MAIEIKKKFKDEKEMMKMMTRYHEALVGSPAYVSSEIALVQSSETEMTICIGNNNDKNLYIEEDDDHTGIIKEGDNNGTTRPGDRR